MTMTHNLGNVFSEGDPQDQYVRISPAHREFAAVTLWVLVTFIQFTGDELLLYPLALYFAIRAWQERSAMLGLMAKSWPIMLLPLWCVVSPIWAVEPAAAFKDAVYLMLTMVICYHAALWLDARKIMYAILLATGFVGVLSILYGLSVGSMVPGLFDQKNMLGTSMTILWVVSLSVLLDKRAAYRIRLAGALLASISIFLIIQSASATAIILATGIGTGLIIGSMLLQGSLLRLGRLSAAFLLGAVALAVATHIVPTLQADLVDQVLESLGKDRSLTGRTVLWIYAENQIREEPILGVGSGGFWRYYESPLIQKIHEDFYKGPNTTFNFHNSLYEIAVHQGLIGLAMAALAVVWGVYWCIRGAVTLGHMPAIFFLFQSAAVLARLAAEADFYKPFILFHMLFWIGALSARKQIIAIKAAEREAEKMQTLVALPRHLRPAN